MLPVLQNKTTIILQKCCVTITRYCSQQGSYYHTSLQISKTDFEVFIQKKCTSRKMQYVKFQYTHGNKSTNFKQLRSRDHYGLWHHSTITFVKCNNFSQMSGVLPAPLIYFRYREKCHQKKGNIHKNYYWVEMLYLGHRQITTMWQTDRNCS